MFFIFIEIPTKVLHQNGQINPCCRARPNIYVNARRPPRQARKRKENGPTTSLASNIPLPASQTTQMEDTGISASPSENVNEIRDTGDHEANPKEDDAGEKNMDSEIATQDENEMEIDIDTTQEIDDQDLTTSESPTQTVLNEPDWKSMYEDETLKT